MKSEQNNQVKVWDIFIRVFHWTLVTSFFIAYLTEDDFEILHTNAGYFVLILLAIRLVYGLIGSKYARFSDFIYPFKTTIQYLKDVLSFRGKRYIGHNPAGGLMIIALMMSLAVTGVTGMGAYATEERAGPLVNLIQFLPYSLARTLEDVHEFFANFTILLVFVHVSGVIFESLSHRENLIKSMLNGFKHKNIQS